MAPPTLLTLTLKTVCRLSFPLQPELTPSLCPIPHTGLVPKACFCTCQPLPVPWSYLQSHLLIQIHLTRPTRGLDQQVSLSPRQWPSTSTPAHPHSRQPTHTPAQLLRSPQYRLSLGEVQERKRGGDKEQVVRTKGVEARGVRTQRQDRGEGTRAGWNSSHQEAPLALLD